MARLQERYEVITGYEAGCMGFHLQRELQQMGMQCEVIAPSSIPRPTGNKVKTVPSATPCVRTALAERMTTVPDAPMSFVEPVPIE